MQMNTDAVTDWLAEDVGKGDLTAALVPASVQASAVVVTREPMVLCGQAWFTAVFRQLDPDVLIHWRVDDGQALAAEAEVCVIHGNARVLLTAERTAMNILQSLSGTATLARSYADAVSGTDCVILDTRKTIPGLRQAQKYAVLCGGCANHRMGLFDAILIKENHILTAGSLAQAVRAARAQDNHCLIEVEVETLEQLQQALELECRRILLDNFDLAQMRQAVTLNQGRAELEVSGNVSLDNVRVIAETGVDYISVGALTKHLQAIDLSMRIRFEPEAS